MRYSRLTIDAWVRVPPLSQTQAAIFAKAGVQFGEVASQTRISPGWIRCSSSAPCSTRAMPRATPDEAATPVSVVTSEVSPVRRFMAEKNPALVPKISRITGSLMSSGTVPSTFGMVGRRPSQYS